MERLNPGSYYSVYLENPSDAIPCVDVRQLADLLPHGSGIDGNYYIRVRKNGNIEVVGEFHRMDEYGGYDGWATFAARVYRLPADKKHDLHDGCYQLTGKKGDVVLDVRGPSDLREFLYDDIHESIKPLLTVRSYGDNCFGPNGRPATFNMAECKWEEIEA